jgi:S-phase kinase-associated protein 1
MDLSCAGNMATVKIVTCDAVDFLVPCEIAAKCGIIDRLLDSVEDELTVSLEMISSSTLERVLKYLETDAFQSPEPNEELIDVVVAANFLDVKWLLDAACQEVAERIKGKSPEEIREIFKLENTYSPEEEAKVRQANAWAFE